MNWNPELYAKAWNFATLAHHGQTYGGAEGQRIDYINHVGSVAMEVLWGLQGTTHYDVNLAVQCALLHDVIEDTETTYDEVEYLFGEDVALGVLALTKDEKIFGKNAQMLDSLERIQAQPHEVWMVKMADRISNLYHPPHFWNQKKITAYQEEAFIIFGALHEASSRLAERLAQKIEDYSQFIGSYSLLED